MSGNWAQLNPFYPNPTSKGPFVSIELVCIDDQNYSTIADVTPVIKKAAS